MFSSCHQSNNSSTTKLYEHLIIKPLNFKEKKIAGVINSLFYSLLNPFFGDVCYDQFLQ